MNLYEHMVLRVREGLAEIHRDRQRALHFMARYGGSPDMDAWLAQLDDEQQKHVLAIEGMAELIRQNPHSPVLHLPMRATRLAKATLRAVPTRRTGTDR